MCQALLKSLRIQQWIKQIKIPPCWFYGVKQTNKIIVENTQDVSDEVLRKKYNGERDFKMSFKLWDRMVS